MVDTGRFKDITLTMPNRDLNLKIETGHEENGIDVVDDSINITIYLELPPEKPVIPWMLIILSIGGILSLFYKKG